MCVCVCVCTPSQKNYLFIHTNTFIKKRYPHTFIFLRYTRKKISKFHYMAWMHVFLLSSQPQRPCVPVCMRISLCATFYWSCCIIGCAFCSHDCKALTGVRYPQSEIGWPAR